MLDYVNRLEAEVSKLPQAACPVWHHFAPGLYARQMFIPAGTVLTGAVHKTEHLCLVSGDIEVTTDEGVRRITALQLVIKSAPGAKRAGFARRDTFWTTVHATDETDLDKLAMELTESTNQQLLGGCENAQLLAEEARADYQRFLAEYGLSQELVTLLVEHEADQIPMPLEFDAIERRASPIEGDGMFATRDIAADEFIAPARIGNNRTPAGRYINHSCHSNVVFKTDGTGGLGVWATRAIRRGDEVTIDYRQAASVNGAGMKPIGRQA
ncbi:TPA: SET domain-containing protein-lysine N-methyltransferase [Burkholderia vietnamiensis]|nr:SET domain-containing protein-lysine N-methyltransferase [Burkholderia vietnamiensis]